VLASGIPRQTNCAIVYAPSVYQRESTKNVVRPYSTRLFSVPKAKGSANISTVDGAFILLVGLSSGRTAAFRRK
jgi:hypothetical protein